MSNHIGQSTRAQMRLSSVTEVLACMRLLVSLRFRMGTKPAHCPMSHITSVLCRRSGTYRPSACANGAICMLLMMTGTSCPSALLCNVCETVTLPWSILL